jgi:hypothetical protein
VHALLRSQTLECLVLRPNLSRIGFDRLLDVEKFEEYAVEDALILESN